ncbi:MAG: endonuclease VIII [Chloroflexi bacterium]|nr:endonuclease VIII [Chloroflexota bacterium]
MIELPEAQTLAHQITQQLSGKTILSSAAAQSPHKFAWYHGDPAGYPAKLNGGKVLAARGIGMFMEITLSSATLLFSDGVNLRLHPAAGLIPAKHQLLLNFEDGSSLSASVAMYGGVVCLAEGENYENSYYATALSKPSPLTEAFDETYIRALLAPDAVRKLPLKAALATEQRVPGLGNGCLQDILWEAHLHPRKKLSALTEQELHQLYLSLKLILLEMTKAGGRSTENDLFGQPGGYRVRLCAESNGKPCPRCGTTIVKEAYLGGSVYTCPTCQKL